MPIMLDPGACAVCNCGTYETMDENACGGELTQG